MDFLGAVIAPDDPHWSTTFPQCLLPRTGDNEGLIGLLLQVDLANNWSAGTALRQMYTSRVGPATLSKLSYSVPFALDLARLARLLGATVLALEPATYIAELSILYQQPAPSPRLLGDAPRFRICPECVQDARLIRREIGLPLLECCPVHDHAFVYRCQCGARLRAFDRTALPFTCASCRLPWDQLERRVPGPDTWPRESRIRAYYNALLGNATAELVTMTNNTIRAGSVARSMQHDDRVLQANYREFEAESTHPVATLVRMLEELQIEPSDLGTTASTVTNVAAPIACRNRLCPLFDRPDSTALRLNGRHLGLQEYYCAHCGSQHLGGRLYATFDLYPYRGDDGPSPAKIARRRSQLSTWRRLLQSACEEMQAAAEPISVQSAFARAGLPRASYLRAETLGLVAIVGRYADQQRAVLQHSGRLSLSMRSHLQKRQQHGVPHSRRSLVRTGIVSDTGITMLSDEEWQALERFVPPRSRPPTDRFPHTRRQICNGIWYRLSTGCSWNTFPRSLPPGPTVAYYRHEWRRNGVWRRAAEALATGTDTPASVCITGLASMCKILADL